MHLLVIAPRDFAGLDLLRRDAGDVAISAGDDIAALRKAAPRADAVLLAPRNVGMLTDLWRDLTNARWIHSLAAGVENDDLGIKLSRMHGDQNEVFRRVFGQDQQGLRSDIPDREGPG